MHVCMCVCVRERVCVGVSMHVCMCVCERERVCACMCVNVNNAPISLALSLLPESSSRPQPPSSNAFTIPHLGRAEHTEGARRSAGQPQLAVDTQVAVGFGQLLGRPDLDGLHLMRSLRLDAVGGQQLLQPHGLCDQHHLDHQVWRRPLRRGGTTSTATSHKTLGVVRQECSTQL